MTAGAPDPKAEGASKGADLNRREQGASKAKPRGSRSRQGRLGAEAAELVASSSLPARVEPVAMPSSLSEFEGWTAADVASWLEGLAPDFRRFRLAVGLGLWVMRDRATEKEYSEQTRKLADAYDVSEDSLWRWRNKAQEHFALPTPSGAQERSSAAIEREKTRRSTPSSQEVGPDAAPVPAAPPSPDPPSGTEAPKRRRGKAAPAEPEPEAPAEPDPKTSIKGRDLRSVVQLLIVTDVNEAAALVELAEARDLASWAERLHTQRRRLARLDRSMSAANVPAAKAKAAPKTDEPCAHPRAARKNLGFATICDPNAGGCGAKIS